MKTLSQSIQLSNTSADERIVKTGALMFFRAIRIIGDYVSEIPAAATQAAIDVADAWGESAPKR
jgi:hypothetical protein